MSFSLEIDKVLHPPQSIDTLDGLVSAQVTLAQLEGIQTAHKINSDQAK